MIPFNFLEVMPVHDSSEHHHLLQALRNGQAPQARDVAERHVLTAGKSLAEWLSGNG
jgi:DNA-binding GntR family transcriptional regulator